MTQKILAHHARSLSRVGGVVVADFARVLVNWVIASEVSWVGMKQGIAGTDVQLRAWRNDRFWPVADHIVDPRTENDVRVEKLMVGVKDVKRDLMMTENRGGKHGSLSSPSRLRAVVDSRQIIAAPVYVSSTSDEELGSHASRLLISTSVEKFHPDSKSLSAVRPLAVGLRVTNQLGTSFCYNFGHNAPNVGLLAITVDDPDFHEATQHEVHVRVDATARALHVAGQTFPCVVGDAELEMVADGGLAGSMSKSQSRKLSKNSVKPNVRQLRTKDSRDDLSW
ncbi:hypothetical protein TI39_contig4178g00008 [Zymoseptoria brevis]|uniref:Uncharacterized protein n=1 Tax=Zymoseptoria brevis TaxID=1047168 RepID=A0A0F4GAY0_9PEZI|nr:hypothetical protein TI39_contig4178g00008 [Zymoseptoria brevis]